jgi:predicted RNase H-like nuclease (RuvC/YqgF family)|tara:strand:- start:90 stop:404 length:315 start_codon:yes stop_codon:yes gene_type:complete
MIDTDKYEGHTEGPWILYTTASHGPTIAGKLNDTDWQLIKDAPLLLEEVKRLQRDITMLENNLEHTRHRFGRSLEKCTETKESLLAEIKRLSLTVEDTGVMRSE